MLDIKFIRDNKDALKKAIRDKKIDLDLEVLLELDKKRNLSRQLVEDLNAEKNRLNSLITKAEEAEREKIIALGKSAKEKLAQTEPELKDLERQLMMLMVKVPNIPSADTPSGKSDADNIEVYNSQNIKTFNFPVKDHIQIGKELDILDLERGAKVGGYRGYYVKNEGASLMLAFMMYAVNKMISKGYSPMIVPTLVKEFSLFGSGYFKGTEYNPEVDEIYEIATTDKEADGSQSKEKKFLVGTAEPSLLAYYSNEVLDESQLPMKLCGYSQCYRSEIGSYGKDTKGLYRVHEFMKVEQVVIGKADIQEAEKLQDEMIGISREMHEELGLPYRQLKICTGDLGAGKYRQYDLEAWLPGLNRWGETGSASIFLDWQARRLNVKYKNKEGQRRFVYMLNNTALPSPRIFIAILENYQQEDGSVVVPEILRKYMPESLAVIAKKGHK